MFLFIIITVNFSDNLRSINIVFQYISKTFTKSQKSGNFSFSDDSFQKGTASLLRAIVFTTNSNFQASIKNYLKRNHARTFNFSNRVDITVSIAKNLNRQMILTKIHVNSTIMKTKKQSSHGNQTNQSSFWIDIFKQFFVSDPFFRGMFRSNVLKHGPFVTPGQRFPANIALLDGPRQFGVHSDVVFVPAATVLVLELAAAQTTFVDGSVEFVNLLFVANLFNLLLESAAAKGAGET